MNKKIASELAIGIILLAAIAIGGIFWMSERKQAINDSKLSQSSILLKKQPLSKENKQTETPCESHYYEGESEVRGWIVSSDKNNGENIIVQIKDEDIKNLPVKNVDALENFTVRLVDPTPQIKKNLIVATEEKPTKITIKGYAEICQKPPLVSLQKATVAFKKS